MIYMVEHTFALPELEDEWNTWYAGNLRVLLSVPGIDTAQRFRVPDTRPPRFMAMYTVSGPEVFDSEAYRSAGGGGTNSLRFRPAYQVWLRNLFSGIDEAPAVGAGQRLLTIDAAEVQDSPPGIALQWGRSVGLHQTTPWRALAVVDASVPLPKARPGATVTVYEPHGPRLSATR